MSVALCNDIRSIIEEVETLDDVQDLSDDDDLFDAGMTSLAAVRLALVLEDRLGIEFNDEVLTRAHFSTIGSIARIVADLRAAD